MKIHFQYNKEKDIWCLLNKGKSSNNSQNPTKEYRELIAQYGENPSEENVSNFIDNYISAKSISIEDCIGKCQNEWNKISDEYHKRAEQIFGIILPADITAYLTINSRCPYSILENYFFVSAGFSTSSAVSTIMHELWHFYTWYGLGPEQEELLGKKKYNDLKEALTVLLNIECADLLPEGERDTGYPQHQLLREKILGIWNKEKDVRKLWEEILRH